MIPSFIIDIFDHLLQYTHTSKAEKRLHEMTKKERCLHFSGRFIDKLSKKIPAIKAISNKPCWRARKYDFHSYMSDIVSIIGEDFPEKEIKFLNDRGINTDMIQKVTGGKTFYWKGKYHENMINRDTITTELNVLEKFNPVLNPEFSSSES